MSSSSLFWKLEFLRSSKRNNWIWKHYFHDCFFSKEKSSCVEIIVQMLFLAFLIFFTQHILDHFLQSYFFTIMHFLLFFLPFMILMLPHCSLQVFSFHDLHIRCSFLWTRAAMSLFTISHYHIWMPITLKQQRWILSLQNWNSAERFISRNMCQTKENNHVKKGYIVVTWILVMGFNACQTLTLVISWNLFLMSFYVMKSSKFYESHRFKKSLT